MESAKSRDAEGVKDLPWPIEMEPRYLALALCGFVVLGLALRVVRYFVNYPIWHDEAFVAVNFLSRGYLDLLRPLDYSQICPLFFLWIELTVVKLFGFSEWSLRFFPTLCALASIGLFWDLARQFRKGLALLLAVAIFAVAFTPIRHGAEVKPYASDLFAALILLRIAVEWTKSPDSSRWLWTFAVVAPLMLGLSYPAIFVASGLCVALAPRALRSPSHSVRIAFILSNASVLLTFVGLFAAFTTAQSAELTSFYRWGYWLDSFPPLAQPWWIPWWLLRIHVGMFMAYPVGGDAGASTLTFLCVLIGMRWLWKQGGKEQLTILCAPFGMGLLAAFLGRYPYGGEARFMQYLAPSTCLLMGIGLARVLERMDRRAWRYSWRRGAVVALAGLGLSQLVMDFVKPYREKEDVLSRQFAQWLWNDLAVDSELICAKTDLGLMFDTDPLHWQRGISSIYQCYQGLYSPRHRRHAPPDLKRVSESHPLRIVFFDRLPDDNPSFHQWMQSIKRSFDLKSQTKFVVFPPRPNEPWKRDGCVLLEFVPRGDKELSDGAVQSRSVAERNDFFRGRF